MPLKSQVNFSDIGCLRKPGRALCLRCGIPFQKEKTSAFGFHSPFRSRVFSRSKVLFLSLRSFQNRGRARPPSTTTTTTTPGHFLISSGAAALSQTDKGGEALPSLSTAGMACPLLSARPLLLRLPRLWAACPRSFGDAPACLPLRLNPSNHPSVSPLRSGPPHPRPSLPPQKNKNAAHTLCESIQTNFKDLEMCLLPSYHFSLSHLNTSESCYLLHATFTFPTHFCG